MKLNESQFSRRYLAALRLHLQGPVHGAGAPAQALGRSAILAGIGSLDVARSHVRALHSLLPARLDGRDGVLRRADPFLLATLAPMQRHHAATLVTEERMHGREKTMKRNAAALRRANKRLQDEIVLRKRAQKKALGSARRQRTLLAQSARLQDQLRRMTRRVFSAQEDERREISRELHDEIAQILTGINVQLAILKHTSTVNDRGLRQRIAHTQRYVENSVTVVHRFARELRPALLDDLGLIPALRAFLRVLAGRKNLRIRFTADPGVEVLASAKRTVLYRVAQEALINVVRHARATLVVVEVRKLPADVTLEVRDDGRAFSVQRVFDSRATRRLGLLGMRERVEMVGGTLAIRSIPGEGTVVSARVPIGRDRNGPTRP